jgi:RimJ/RimL family protein N-acetyltransferase
MGGAGVVGIVGLHPALAEFPPDHLQAMTAVAPALRGRGIAVRAVNAMMDVFCEREPSARAIIAIVDAQNEPSLRAVVRMRGFTRRESALRTRGREFIIFEFGGCAPSSERK